jgi:GH25 family lysozyme M1 (1,4-beta-N-acetylmuramidase)
MARTIDSSILQAALVGLQSEKEKIDNAMAAIRKQLGGRGATAVVTTNGTKTARHMSAAAKKRIADAQRKRWAAFHKAKVRAAKPMAKAAGQAAPKRNLSAAAKARLAANLAKARAAKGQKAAAATA